MQDVITEALCQTRELSNQISPVVCPGPSAIHCFFSYSDDQYAYNIGEYCLAYR